MSKKSFNEFYNDYLNNQELYKHIQKRKEAMEISWNFCESQHKAEVEGLKTKFSEATQTYTDDIDGLEKENEELKKKLDEAVLIIEDLCSSAEECPERATAREFLKGVKGE